MEGRGDSGTISKGREEKAKNRFVGVQPSDAEGASPKGTAKAAPAFARKSRTDLQTADGLWSEHVKSDCREFLIWNPLGLHAVEARWYAAEARSGGPLGSPTCAEPPLSKAAMT